MELKTILISKIRPNPFQPRETFEKETIQELADSIKASDLVQPILVRKDGDTYEIIAGERRWRAYQFAKIKEIPCIVREPRPDDIETRELSIIENWHRLRLEPNEAEKFIAKLYEDGVKEGRYKSLRDMERKTGISNQILSRLVMAHKERKEVGLQSTLQEKLTYEDYYRTRPLEREPEVRKIVLEKRARGELRQRDELRSFSETVAKASEPVKKAMLKPKSKITPEKAEIILKLPDEESQKAVIEQVEALRLDEDETRTVVEQFKQRVEVPTPAPEEWKEIEGRYKRIQEETKTRLADPEVQKKGKLFRNWVAHTTLQGGLESAVCPICGAGHENLVWKCHDLTVKEALGKAREKYQESIKERR